MISSGYDSEDFVDKQWWEVRFGSDLTNHHL